MKKKINVLYWWSFWILYLEIIYRIFILNNFFSLKTFSMLIFSIPFILLFSFLTSIFKEKNNRIICIVLSLFISILFLAQIVYFKFYNSMFSIFSLTQGGVGQVFQFLTAIIRVILHVWYIFVLVFIPYIIYVEYKNNIDYSILKNKKIYLYKISLFIISIISMFLLDSSLYSYKRLFFDTHAPLLTINKTSLLTMEVLDIHRYIFGSNEKLYISSSINDKEYSNNDYNIMNIDFESLAQNEKESNIIKMHEYFKSVEPTKKNKYTSLFKNKNIIVITAESFDTIGIDEKLTPTLYKMVNNSFVFNNYYQPLYPISTYDGEFMNLTGLLPREGTWSLRKISNNTIPFVYGNMFKDNNYNTYAFHNYVYNFYERELSHPKLGFDYIACGNGLEKNMNCDNWPNSDLEMINATSNYLDNKPFALYYLTVSGHLNYNERENYISKKNSDKVSNLKYSSRVKSYIATQIELDLALEKLLEELEKRKTLDDTLIVVGPDHFPYGLTTKELDEVSVRSRSNKFENHHTSLIMYNPKIEKAEINKVVSGIDIMPTIYNLFGLEYDSRLLIGRDALSDEDGIIIFSDRSWITDKGTYDSITNTFNGKDVDKEYIDRINKIVNERISVSISIVDKDYYSKLGL